VKQYIHSFSDINKIIDWTWSFRFYNSVDSSWTMKWSRMGAHHRLIPLRGHAPLLLIWSSRWAPSMTKHHNSYPSIHPSIHPSPYRSCVSLWGNRARHNVMFPRAAHGDASTAWLRRPHRPCWVRHAHTYTKSGKAYIHAPHARDRGSSTPCQIQMKNLGFMCTVVKHTGDRVSHK
jgi:hypothetical protein